MMQKESWWNMALILTEEDLNFCFGDVTSLITANLSKQEEIDIKAKEEEIIAKMIRNSMKGVLVGRFAKILKSVDIDIGQNRLFKWLRTHKYLDGRNIPYQRYVDAGYFYVREIIVNEKLRYTTLITGKGQAYFAKKLLDEKHSKGEKTNV